MRAANPDGPCGAARRAWHGWRRMSRGGMLSEIGGRVMTAITFDTLKFVERLTAAGVPDAQAKAEASALRDVLAEALDTTVVA